MGLVGTSGKLRKFRRLNQQSSVKVAIIAGFQLGNGKWRQGIKLGIMEIRNTRYKLTEPIVIMANSTRPRITNPNGSTKSPNGGAIPVAVCS